MTELHCHTTASDGTLAPSEMVRLAASRDISLLAITDHDTVEGLEEAAGAARSAGVELLAGMELSVQVDRRPVHLLAYGFDPSHPAIRSYGVRLKGDRRRRADAMLDRLTDMGYAVDPARVQDHAQGVVARPHIADELVRVGAAEDRQDAFERLIGDDGPACVPLASTDSAQAIALIHQAGGVIVLAHPGHWTQHRTILRLIQQGLDGLETRHPSHDTNLVVYYQELADRYGLLATGGADFHGAWPGEEERLGGFAPSEHRLGQLRERLLARQSSIRS